MSVHSQLMDCPNCRAAMTSLTLDGHLSTPVSIDVCLPCQAIWFDGYESLQLSPASVLKLFRLIGEQPHGTAVKLSDMARCPRCELRLMPTHDMQRATR